MRIKDFEIENLYGKYSFKSRIDEKVNIIIGNNGTFKSTILGFIRFLAFNGVEPTFTYESAAMSLEDDVIVISKPTTSHSNNSDEKARLSLTLSSREVTKNGEEMPLEEFAKCLKLDFISTFDIKDKDVNTQQTLLDKRLVQLQSDYGYYLNGLLKKFTENLSAQGNVTKEDYNKIYARKILFEILVNEAFKETGKVLDNNSDKLRFIIDEKTAIDADKLSSGEKQLLIILLTVLLEDGQEYVLMMDEPEISMHISWQYKLIDMILQLNPNVQIILTTHSPMIFSDGWGDKAIYMENITTNTRK